MNRLLAASLLVALLAILLATPTLAMGADERRLKGGGTKVHVCTRLGIPAYIKLLALALYWYFIDAASLFSKDAHQFSPFRLEYKSISEYQGPKNAQDATPHRGASVEGMYSTTVSHTHVPVLMLAVCYAASLFSRMYFQNTYSPIRSLLLPRNANQFQGTKGPKGSKGADDR